MAPDLNILKLQNMHCLTIVQQLTSFELSFVIFLHSPDHQLDGSIITYILSP